MSAFTYRDERDDGVWAGEQRVRERQIHESARRAAFAYCLKVIDAHLAGGGGDGALGACRRVIAGECGLTGTDPAILAAHLAAAKAERRRCSGLAARAVEASRLLTAYGGLRQLILELADDIDRGTQLLPWPAAPDPPPDTDPGPQE